MNFDDLMKLNDYHIMLHELRMSELNDNLGAINLHFKGSKNPTNLLIDNEEEIDNIEIRFSSHDAMFTIVEDYLTEQKNKYKGDCFRIYKKSSILTFCNNVYQVDGNMHETLHGKSIHYGFETIEQSINILSRITPRILFNKN